MTRAFIVKLEIGTEVPQTIAQEIKDDLEEQGYHVQSVAPWSAPTEAALTPAVGELVAQPPPPAPPI